MTAAQLEAWTVAIIGLANAGVQMTEAFVAAWKSVMAVAHSDAMTQAEIDAAWQQIRMDARVGLALATAQSGGEA